MRLLFKELCVLLDEVYRWMQHLEHLAPVGFFLLSQEYSCVLVVCACVNECECHDT